MSVPPTGVAGDPQFDYGVIDISDSRRLAPGEPIDSWMSASPPIANVAASALSEPEDLARKILKRRGKGFRTAGYPGDKECMPVQTDAFEFVALERGLASPHNVLQHRADMFFGMSGAPVWLKGAGRDAPGGRKPHSLIGIVEGGIGPILSDRGFRMTFSTLITPKVLNRLTRTEFLSSL